MPSDLAIEPKSARSEVQTVAPGPENKATFAAGIGAVAIVTLFLWIIHNRYLPIAENWFSYYGKLMHDGKLPYRDFYFFTQPLSLLISWAVYGISDKMIYLRYFGFLERVCLTGALYFLISRRFSPVASFWATVLPMFFFLAYCSEAFFTYLVTCCLFFILSLVFLELAFEKQETSQRFFFLAGFAASLSFLAKQSNGLFVTAAVIFLAGSLNRSGARDPWKQGARRVSLVLAGWLVPQAVLVSWLRYYGLTNLYIQQVFRGAAASKGGLPKLLFGLFLRASTPATGICLLITGFMLWRARRKGWRWLPAHAGEPGPWRGMLLWSTAAAAAAVVTSYFVPSGIFGLFLARTSAMLIPRVAFWISLVAFLTWVVRLLRTQRRDDPLLPIVVVGGFCWAYASGLSWDVEQQAVLVIISLGVAICYEAFRTVRARIAFVLLLTGWAGLVTWQKYQLAFEWEGWRESISHTPVSSHWPRLAGYRTGPAQMGMLDTILDDVARFSRPGESVFTFPFLPMFNFVPDRPQPTFCVVHYWDVCPDWVAEADAERVRLDKPRVIVEMGFSEEFWQLHERGFRANSISGQREIKRVIDELVSSGDYILQENFASPGFGDPIRVWVRVR
jgi:hypothetical protein